MDENLYYYKKKYNRFIWGFVILAIVIFIIAYIFGIHKNVENGTYTKELMMQIIFFYLLLTIGSALYYKFVGWLAFKSKGWYEVAVALTFPLGFILMLPILKYHNSNGDLILPTQDKMFKATIKAYQKAWKRQNFVSRVVLPLFYLVVAYAIVQGFILLETNYPDVILWICFAIVVIAYIFTLYLIGGVRDVTVTTTNYDISVGTGWLDYGEVYVNETGSSTKDTTDVSLFAMIIAAPLTPIILMIALIAIVIFLGVSLLRIILPFTGTRSIYLHEKTMVHPNYLMGGRYFRKLAIIINKFLRLVFKINLVNEDFWYNGVGTSYIRKYLSPKNKEYLERLLEKVDQKHGGHYDF